MFQKHKVGLFGSAKQQIIGAPIDQQRPIIENPDGSFSTEETITVGEPGRGYYNVPTIVDGQRLDPNDAEDLFWSGRIPHVGKFRTVEEAIKAARARTDQVGILRGVR